MQLGAQFLGNHVGVHGGADDLWPDEQDEFGVQRALVTIADPRDAAVRASNPKAARDYELWTAMDQASKDVAKLATLPGIDQLRGKLVGLLLAPATKLARLLMEPGAQLARLASAKGSQENAG